MPTKEAQCTKVKIAVFHVTTDSIIQSDKPTLLNKVIIIDWKKNNYHLIK